MPFTSTDQEILSSRLSNPTAARNNSQHNHSLLAALTAALLIAFRTHAQSSRHIPVGCNTPSSNCPTLNLFALNLGKLGSKSGGSTACCQRM
jgi:hypothetical protein